MGKDQVWSSGARWGWTRTRMKMILVVGQGGRPPPFQISEWGLNQGPGNERSEVITWNPHHRAGLFLARTFSLVQAPV